MTEISRRGLVALGGASLALSACSPAATIEPGPTGGTDGNYGDDPSSKGPGPLVADYYSLVILRLNADLKWEASYGSFSSPSKDDEAKVRAAVLEQLNDLPAGGDVQSLKPLDKSSGYDFEDWGFGGPRRVYIYVDNATIKFAKDEPMSFKSTSSLRYTDQDRAKGRKINRNKSFYNAQAVEQFAKGTLLYVENFFRDPEGKPLPVPPTDKQYYSINFNLLMETTKGTRALPVIIDPDTGNGMGWPPP